MKILQRFCISLVFVASTMQPIRADWWNTTSSYCQNAWQSTQKKAASTINYFSPQKKDDNRILILGALGLATSCLGLWVIKKGVDTLNADQIKLLQHQLGHNQTLTRGILTTSLGIICAITGVILIVASKPIVKHIN